MAGDKINKFFKYVVQKLLSLFEFFRLLLQNPYDQPDPVKVIRHVLVVPAVPKYW